MVGVCTAPNILTSRLAKKYQVRIVPDQLNKKRGAQAESIFFLPVNTLHSDILSKQGIT